MHNYLFLTLILLSSFSLSAQRTCGSDQLMEQLMSNPEYVKDHQERILKFEAINQNRQNRSAACTNIATLPMAVHFQNITNPDIACLTALAVDQVRILNEDYQGTNADITNWTNSAAASFPGISNAETCIEFCIATQNHPAGYGLSNGDLAITFNEFSNDNNADWSGYINIFVRNIQYLGYSPFPGSGNGDGVTIDDQAFGLQSLGCGSVTAGNPYILGRTLTHELGHYLLLDHIWGNGCNTDDGIADTPDSQSEYYGCPNVGVSSCNSTDMHMNYMDYVDDPCMYMFTAGQATVMENYVASNLQNVINKGTIVCGPVVETCDDGVQNQDETGVDCGGTICPVCPTCFDGIQNQDETDIDCGGAICAACPPTCTDGIQNQDETDIDCGGATCPACPTCSDGIQNQGEEDIDCGGPCGLCPCNGIAVQLTILLDRRPEQTSWDITDANGTVVASGGTYPNEPDNSTLVIDICLPTDGCYDFNAYDTNGNGIRQGGYYSLVDADGVEMVNISGNFGAQETVNFCVEGGCQPFLNLSNVETSATKTEQAIDYVTSNSSISGSANVTYHAGNYVEMTNDFEVIAGAEFCAYILECSAATLLVADPTDTDLWVDFEKSQSSNTGIIKFNIPTASKVAISLISINGNEVLNIDGNEILKAGTHQININNLQLKAGIYFCKIITDEEEKVVKLSLNR